MLYDELLGSKKEAKAFPSTEIGRAQCAGAAAAGIGSYRPSDEGAAPSPA